MRILDTLLIPENLTYISIEVETDESLGKSGAEFCVVAHFVNGDRHYLTWGAWADCIEMMRRIEDGMDAYRQQKSQSTSGQNPYWRWN
jgi:hypothetical protein